jgi:glycosyltransferase involved in cell wall biosynthesis
MLTGKNIIIISSIEWNALWQGSQEIAERLAKAGNRVLYLENMGVRSPTWKDKSRIAKRAKGLVRFPLGRGVRQVATNLYVCPPLVLPPFGKRRQRMLNRLLLPLILRTANSLGMNDPILWTFLPTDTALDLISLFRARCGATVIYHCTADFSQLTHRAAQLQESEKKLLQLSELVFVTCRQLAEHCGPWNDNVHIFPNGVSVEVFHNGNGHTKLPAASVLTSLPGPIIGYIGGLHRFVDFDLLTAMARRRPEWSWVFVGPIQTPVQALAQLTNVHFLGQQPHRDLGQFLHNFDVCIVPYIKSSATKTVVPTKVNEYLAAGKPVVSTELLTICDFNKQHDVLLTAPSHPDHFLRAIGDSLRLPVDSETVARRIAVAKLNDWQAQLEKMSSLINRAVNKNR